MKSLSKRVARLEKLFGEGWEPLTDLRPVENTHSLVRPVFGDRPQSLIDQIVKGVAEALRQDYAHAQTARHDDLAPVVTVFGDAAERQVDDATIRSMLRHKINECRNEAGVHDINFASADSLAALNHNLTGSVVVSHIENPPQPSNLDLSNETAGTAANINAALRQIMAKPKGGVES